MATVRMYMVMTITTTLIIMHSLVISYPSVHAVPTVIYPNNDAVSLPLHTSAADKITPVESLKNTLDTSGVGGDGDTVKPTILPSLFLQMDSRVAKEMGTVTMTSSMANETDGIINRETTGNANDSNAMNATSEVKNQFNDEVVLSSDESSLPLLATQSDALAESIPSVTTTIATPSESETTSSSNTKLLSNQTGVSFVKSYVMNQTQSTDGAISSSEFTSSPPPVSARGENEISPSSPLSSSSSPSQVSTSSTTFVPSSTSDFASDSPRASNSETRQDVDDGDKIKHSSAREDVSTKATLQTAVRSNNNNSISPSPQVNLEERATTTAASTTATITTSTAAITTTDATAATSNATASASTTTDATATATSTKEIPVTFAVSHANQTTREGRTDDSGESMNYDGINIPTTLPASSLASSTVDSTTTVTVTTTTTTASPATPASATVTTDGQTVSGNTSNSSSTIPVTLQPLLSETLATNSLSSSITDQSKSPPSELMTTPVAFNSSTPESPSTWTTTASSTTVTTAITSTTAAAVDASSETPASHVDAAMVTTLNNNTSSTSTSLPDAGTESTSPVHGSSSNSDVTSGNSTPLETATSPAGGTNWTIVLPPAVTPSPTSDLPLEKDVKDTSLENNDLGPSEVPGKGVAASPTVAVAVESDPAPTTVTSGGGDLGDHLASSSPSLNVSVTPHDIYPELPSNDVTGDINSSSGNETETDVKTLEASESPPGTVSKDRSSRREAHSLMSMCMNSVEIFVVSVVLIFFAASALVVCLLVGFCRRKGNTFDVQDPRNPLPPNFPRGLLSKPAHSNCKVTGPAIFGSHPLSRLQGYDLNNPADILKDEEGHTGHYTSRSRSSPSGYSVNNNNNNNNGKDGEKDSISLQPLHFCGPADYIKKSSTLEYPAALNAFSFKNHQPFHAGYHSSSGYKSLPGAGRILVNDAWMVLPQITCPTDHRRTSYSLSSRTSSNSYEHPSRRHSCPPRPPMIHLAPGITSGPPHPHHPPYVYHGPEHFPYGLPPSCFKCATLTRNGPINDNSFGFFPVSPDEIEYRPTPNRKNQTNVTANRRGSSASPQSATESADSNNSGHRQCTNSNCKSSHKKSSSPSTTMTTTTTGSQEVSSPPRTSNGLSEGLRGKKSPGHSYLKEGYYSTEQEITDTKL